jgi:protein-S-isoprenylcysteine O-methyltransferase Ste14
MLTRLGGWLFKHRTAIPIPIVLAILLLPPASSSIALGTVGIALVAVGEALRLLAVRQIGAVSRTRSDRLGPLVASGPFRWVRNPLYLGNIALWLGLALAAGLPWLVAPITLLLALEYHAIVRWEEQLLAARLGEPYRRYLAMVPRWLPTPPSAAMKATSPGAPFTWRDTLFSERGTLIAIGVGLLLLWAKASLQLTA